MVKFSSVVTAKKVPALVGVFRYEDNLGGEVQPLQSTLMVAQTGTRFVKYRFTYPVSVSRQAIAEITKFTNAFRWP